MDITGRLIKILPEVSGESARGKWVRGGFVIETGDTYPRQVAFTMFGEDKLAMINGIQLNSTVMVTFSPESREFNERWYTDLRCIRVQQADMSSVNTMAQQAAPSFAQAPVAAPAPNPTAQPPVMPTPNSNDDLPF